MKRIIKSILAVPLLIGFFQSQVVLAKSQSIELKSGWNLIALSVEPEDSSVSEIFKPIGDAFVAVWGFDKIDQDWTTFPEPLEGASTVTSLDVGKGYWVKVTRNSTLLVDSAQDLSSGQLDLHPGWNLVGFTTETETPYGQLLDGVSFNQLWSFNTAANQFEGIVLLPGSNEIIREDFKKIEPGKAYWIQVDEQVQVGPVLATSLPGDIDVEPFLELGDYGVAIPWSNKTLGDINFGGDNEDNFDYPTTQRAILIDETVTDKQFTIFNDGSGILSWNAQVLNPQENSWLKLEIFNEGESELSIFNQGQLAGHDYNQKIVVNRAHMAPGEYTAQIEISSNGSVGNDVENEAAEQQKRIIQVIMKVPDILGAYNVLVHIETVEYQDITKSADMHNSRLFLSIFEDATGLKGIIDEEQTLLIPDRFYFTGNYIENSENEFSLAGSNVLPERLSDSINAKLNPYNIKLQRDISLVGVRADSPGGGSLNLQGEYTETIRNIFDSPIFLKGTFTALRRTEGELTTDRLSVRGEAAPIPDSPTIFESSINIDKSLVLNNLKLNLNLSHSRPSDIKVRLVSPLGKVVRLRENDDAPMGILNYGDDLTPLDSFEIFYGESTEGKWTLVIEDTTPGEEGYLVDWSLDFNGTAVHRITGTLDGFPDGTPILLTGCGQSHVQQLNLGAYTFENLVNCVYSVSFIHPAYIRSAVDIVLSGENITLSSDAILSERNYSAKPEFTVFPKLGFTDMEINLIDKTFLPKSEVIRHTWTIYKWNGAQSDVYQVLQDDHDAKYTLTEEGIYSVKLDIYKSDVLLHSINKDQLFIIVGETKGDSSLPLSEQRIISTYTTQGAGGHKNLPYANDSATFDIDRPPYDANNPGHEDSDHFTAIEDSIKHINIPSVNSLPNQKLDSAVGVNSRRIFVNIGQPISGTMRSLGRKLSVGPNL